MTMTAAKQAERIRQEGRHGTAAGDVILPFPLLPIRSDKPRCCWCGDEFTPAKPNQAYCRPKHRQYACAARRAAMVTAVAALLMEYGASPSTARTKAEDVVEAHYRPARPGLDGRATRAMKAMGWRNDAAAREWGRRAVSERVSVTKPSSRDI